MSHQFEYQIGINTDPLADGFQGRIGKWVFRTLNGVTIVSRRPRKPRFQSAMQRDNRQRFRLATEFAKREMLDPVRKEYYRNMAEKAKPHMRNAYTAAIKTYMSNDETIVKNFVHVVEAVTPPAKSSYRTRKKPADKSRLPIQRFAKTSLVSHQAKEKLRNTKANRPNSNLYLANRERLNEIAVSGP